MPNDNEPTLVLVPPARQGLVMFAAASGVCIAVGFFMALAAGANFLAWLALGFTGVIGLCAAGYLLPASSALILSPQGFTVRFASRAVFYSWNEVEQFAVAERSIVAFRLSDCSQRISPTVRQLTGYDGALPTAYGSLPPEVLAAQLNECRSRLAEESAVEDE